MSSPSTAGPGNALINDWVERSTGAPLDRDGALAAPGQVDAARLAQLLDNPYFATPAPKSPGPGTTSIRRRWQASP